MRKRGKHSALVVGLGRFGSAAAQRLVALGWDVVGVDVNPEVVQDMADRLGHVVQLDASDEEAMATIGVPQFEVCIVSRATSIESSILLILTLQALGAKYIVAKASTDRHAQILRRLDVQQIVFPERDAGIRLAEALQAPHLVEWIDLPGEKELGAIQVPEEQIGASLRTWLRLQHPGLRILVRLGPDGRVLNTDPDEPLGRGETVVVFGSYRDILSVGR